MTKVATRRTHRKTGKGTQSYAISPAEITVMKNKTVKKCSGLTRIKSKLSRNEEKEVGLPKIHTGNTYGQQKSDNETELRLSFDRQKNERLRKIQNLPWTSVRTDFFSRKKWKKTKLNDPRLARRYNCFNKLRKTKIFDWYREYLENAKLTATSTAGTNENLK